MFFSRTSAFLTLPTFCGYIFLRVQLPCIYWWPPNLYLYLTSFLNCLLSYLTAPQNKFSPNWTYYLCLNLSPNLFSPKLCFSSSVYFNKWKCHLPSWPQLEIWPPFQTSPLQSLWYIQSPRITYFACVINVKSPRLSPCPLLPLSSLIKTSFVLVPQLPSYRSPHISCLTCPVHFPTITR